MPLELHQVLRLPRKVTLELHQVLRLPRKVTLDLHQVLRLPRKVTLDLHQVLRLPHRMTRRLDPRHIWNVISNARRNKCHPPNSPNTAPATQNDHPTSAEICGKQLKRHFQCAADPRPFRDRSEHDPRPFASVRNPPRNRGYFSRSGRTVCIEKYNISRSGYLSKFHQVLRLPRKVTLELHQVLRLPRKVTLELHQVLRLPRKVTLDLHQVLRLPHRMTRRLDPRHIWNVISNARRNKCHPPNSPNTAPATQNDHPTSGRNLRKTAETSFPMRGRSETVPRPFRDRSEHDPRPFASVRNPPRNRGCFSRSGRTVCIEKYNISRSGYLSKFHQVLRLPLKVPLELHQVLRLPRKVTLELHQVLRLPRKVTLDLHQVLRLPHRMTRRLDPRHIWNVISNARRNKCHPPNSPNTAPATQNDHPTSAEICGKQLKRHFQCAADPRPFRDRSEHDPRPFASVRNPPRNRGYFSRSGRTVCIEKYNISRSGYLSKFHQVLRLPRKVTLELHQVLRLPRKLTLELHQVLRLPRKVTLDLHQVLRLPHRMTRRLDPRHIWNVISNARRNKCHPPNSPNTAPATQNDHPTSGRNLRKTAETSFPMRGRSETVPRPFRAWSETVCVSPQPATQPRLLFALRTNGLYWKIQHFALRLSFQISPSPAPTTKSATWTSPSTAPTTQSDTWTSPSTAPTTKSDTWPSPSTAPATQNDSRL